MSRRGGGAGGAGGFGQMQQLMKQAQAMQKNIQKIQEEAETKTVEGQSASGLVRVTMNGKQMIQDIIIKKECVDPSDVDMLQDLVKNAVNDATQKSKDMMEQEMAKVSGGMSIPGLF